MRVLYLVIFSRPVLVFTSRTARIEPNTAPYTTCPNRDPTIIVD